MTNYERENEISTDEIIKRLERCVKRGNRNYDTDIVLDLINRQKAEIERLKECPKCIYEYDGKTTEYCVQGPCSNFKTVEQIKSEAYKEFAEKLKKRYDNPVWYLGGSNGFFDNLDNFVKEMVGDTE